MEYEKAIEVLKKLMEKHPLSAEEKEALTTAMGLLSAGSLAMGRIRALKVKRDKSTEW